MRPGYDVKLSTNYKAHVVTMSRVRIYLGPSNLSRGKGVYTMMYFEQDEQGTMVLVHNNKAIKRVAVETGDIVAKTMRIPVVIFNGTMEINEAVRLVVERGDADPIWLEV